MKFCDIVGGRLKCTTCGHLKVHHPWVNVLIGCGIVKSGLGIIVFIPMIQPVTFAFKRNDFGVLQEPIENGASVPSPKSNVQNLHIPNSDNIVTFNSLDFILAIGYHRQRQLQRSSGQKTPPLLLPVIRERLTESSQG